ncbi:MAG: hypothetical protein IID46_02150 [Planctomycetes bacterium]|nr:hypothetical protein [Planctomycetota bacterium]
MINRRLQLVLLTGTVLTVLFFWLTEIPLGVPGEWTWNRIRIDDGQTTDLLLGGGMAVIAGLLYIGLAWMGDQRMAVGHRLETAGWMTGLVAIGFLWLSAIQDSPPGEEPQLKPMLVLYDPGTSGYFFEASHHIETVSAFLAGYEERMTQGDVLHVGTHPPGLFVFHYGLIQLCRSSTGFSNLILQTQPQRVAEAFSEVEPGISPLNLRLRESDRAALWLAALVTQLVGVLTVVPLFLLLRRDYSRRTSWRVTVLWPLVPALAIFLPKSDALYPALGLFFLWVWLEGRCRHSRVMCLSAGLLIWLGMFLSLAFVPIAVLAVLLTVWEYKNSGEANTANAARRKLLISIVWATVGLIIPIVALWFAYDINMFKVWLWNYRNHASFYEQYSRTYWKWLLVNPLELIFAVGAPIVIICGVAMFRSFGSQGNRRSRFGAYCLCPIVWGVLWLSGKNMGEAARLWLIFIPWCIWLTVAHLDVNFESQAESRSTTRTSQGQRDWLFLLVMQTIVCIATVSRVRGFQFAGL